MYPYRSSYHFYRKDKISKISELRYYFGDILADILHVFYSMPREVRVKFFKEYAEKHGQKSMEYALKSYIQWKNGRKSPSTETQKRILQIMPKYISVQDRINIFLKLRQRFRKKDLYKEVRANIDDGLESLILKHVNEMFKEIEKEALPSYLLEHAKWLVGDEVKAMEKLIKLADIQENLERIAYIKKEVKNIRDLYFSTPNIKVLYHEINLSIGKIKLIVNSNTSLKGICQMPINNGSKFEIEKTNQSLLDILADPKIGEAEIKSLKVEAIKAKLRLDENTEAAKLRFDASSTEISQTINAVRSLEQSDKVDFSVDSKFETASGSTHIVVSKSTNNTVIVVSIVIGIIILACITCGK